MSNGYDKLDDTIDRLRDRLMASTKSEMEAIGAWCALKKEFDDLTKKYVELADEKTRYQGIVYHVCNVLDTIDGNRAGRGITIDRVKARMDKMLEVKK